MPFVWEAVSNLGTAFYDLPEKMIVSATVCVGRLSVWWCWWRGNALDLGAPCWNLGTCGFDWLLGMAVLGSEMWSSGSRLQCARIHLGQHPPFPALFRAQTQHLDVELVIGKVFILFFINIPVIPELFLGLQNCNSCKIFQGEFVCETAHCISECSSNLFPKERGHWCVS